MRPRLRPVHAVAPRPALASSTVGRLTGWALVVVVVALVVVGGVTVGWWAARPECALWRCA